MKNLPILILGAACLCVGCSGGGTELSKAEDAKVKSAFKSGDGNFDINKVPPEQRDRVRGFMNMGKKGPASAGN